MNEQMTLLDRLGRLFKRSRTDGETLVRGEITSGGLVRPWGRNQAAITQLQEGFHSLTELMNAVKQNMESQNLRQSELLEHLSALPRVLEILPESSRLQGQTLKAIQDQLMHQAEQQQTLGEILERLSDAGGEQRDVLEGLRQRMETLNQQDHAMADSLNTVSATLESASRNSTTSAEVLGQLRDNLRQRDGDLERVFHKQTTRFTTMLAIAIFMSIGSLVAVVVMGFLMLKAGK